MDSQVSTTYEPSVSVAGDGDASVPMEPYQWPATYQPPSMSREVSVFLLLVVVMHPYRWSRTNGQQHISHHLCEVTISSHP